MKDLAKLAARSQQAQNNFAGEGGKPIRPRLPIIIIIAVLLTRW